MKKNNINTKTSILCILLCLSFIDRLYPQESINLNAYGNRDQIVVSPVKLDGNVLFNLRGVSSYPAEERSNDVSKRIKSVAADYSIRPDMVKIVQEDNHSVIYAGNQIILRVYDVDTALEGIDRELFAKAIELKIKKAIETYRYERSKPALEEDLKKALLATVILIAILIGLLWLIRRIDMRLQNRIKRRIESVENISFKLIKPNQIWRVFHTLIRTIRIILVIFIIVFFVDYVLSLFPWTNAFSKYTINLILDPIKEIGLSFINYIPKLAFLIIIYFIFKYVLNLVKLFFLGIEEGNIVLKDFKPEWSISTFKIVKLFIIAFAVIISYPYIPGSNSIAFKGISVFVGILFSLGSSSFIGNLIAGYTMIYRGAFKKGDRIEVDNQIGIVEEQQLMVTRLRSHKNEEIVIPNSVLVNSKIINYTAKAQDKGLIIHTIVGIGYETPWRQVDAMLKLAAHRTEGILKSPPPFVLQKVLGDFAVNYEINGYCKDIDNINRIYTALHQNILDVFNENDVQIMTPAYEGDPDIPKVVPKDKWETPLASKK